MTASEIVLGIPLVFMALVLGLIIQGSIVQYDKSGAPLPATRNTTTLPEPLEAFGVAAVLRDASFGAKLQQQGGYCRIS
ncbi:MAG TPA: hypothetical protein VIF02_12335 [Methylocella sp.]|jgi:hypothetical protein